MINIIVAADLNNAIGKDNRLLWHLPLDLKNFKKLTLQHPVIMGRKTFESIGKPLPNRTNIVLTQNQTHSIQDKYPEVICSSNFENALHLALQKDEEIFVIGGAKVYQKAMKIADRIYFTQVLSHFDADTFFPPIFDKDWTKISEQKFLQDKNHPYNFNFITYQKTPS